MKVRCAYCGKVVDEDDVVEYAGMKFCSECFEYLLMGCPRCKN